MNFGSNVSFSDEMHDSHMLKRGIKPNDVYNLDNSMFRVTSHSIQD